MNKAGLASAIADKVGVTKKQAEEMLDAMVDIVIRQLQKNDEVTITGFGSFSSFIRKGREGVNPQKPAEKIDISPTKVARFKPGSTLKKAMKEAQTVSAPVSVASDESM
ncbi:TPA: hypothetical protein DF272_04500 [Candidatus Falkowbacteria bacterium]|nr:hypothetical protein [Candidatus Falkowbacteria bacterium]